MSATLPGEVLEMTGKFMTEPLRVLVNRDELTLEVRHLSSTSLRELIRCCAGGSPTASRQGLLACESVQRHAAVVATVQAV